MIKNFISMLHIYFVFHQKLPQKINSKIFPDGRSQIIYNKNKKVILVDYAHTQEAFENLLSNLPKDIDHKIIIFGCGGDRDKTKRTKMAKIAPFLIASKAKRFPSLLFDFRPMKISFFFINLESNTIIELYFSLACNIFLKIFCI